MTDHTTRTIERTDGDLGPILRALAHAPLVPKAPAVGDVVDGRYELLDMLGRGGMGVVFDARDRRTERRVALKWMSRAWGAECDYASSLSRFVREARIAATISHPNIVSVFDVNAEHSPPYLVMERLRGETLRTLLTRSTLSWDEALRVLVPAMRGASALHRAGIVHRDLKPDNIFLCEGSAEQPPATKVLDFGVSLVESDEGLTGSGAVLGTPAYMPLEQLRASREVGPAADVYALGVVLYEAIAGVRPFDARSAADHAIVLATRRPRHLAEVAPAVAGPRADAVMRAISREACDRFPSIEAFVRALVEAEPRARGRGRVARVAVLVAVTSLIAVGIAFSGRKYAARPPVSAPRVADSPREPVRLDPPVQTTPTPPVDTASGESDASVESRRAARHRAPRPAQMAPRLENEATSVEPELERALRLPREDFH